MPAFVEVVIENLKATSNWDSGKDYPLTHFLKFMSYEKDAIKWFLYEVVALRWMWGESRIDYVRSLVDFVDLDSYFPIFPGGNQSMTIRQFLMEHLTPEELDYIEMMPPLVPCSHFKVKDDNVNKNDENIIYQEDENIIDQNTEEDENILNLNTEDDEEVENMGPIKIEVNEQGRRIITTAASNPHSVESEKKQKPQRVGLSVRFLRESGDDDVITVKPSGKDIYKLVFHDTSVNKKHKVKNMTAQEVHMYFSEIFRMASVDADPYQSIQLDFPARPQVLLPYNIDSYTRDLVYDSIESVMKNWPQVA